MDPITLHSFGTVSAFIAFIAICRWAYNGKHKARFEEAANLPFADDEHPVEERRQ